MAPSGCCYPCVLFAAVPFHALDPNKNTIQHLRESSRIRASSLPAGISAIVQTSNCVPWFESSNREFCAFDGVRMELLRKAGVSSEVRFTLSVACTYEKRRNREVVRGRR
jgi:hypothetical protein